MKRGEIYNVRLDPTVGSGQASSRPVVIVSRDAINNYSPVVLAVPCTTYRGQPVFPSQFFLPARDGGLDFDSVVMAEQVRAINKERLTDLRGMISVDGLQQLDRALLIALDLPEVAAFQ
ncbi:MAG: type II toxin-antitoxin system PemK/MazF family toxin [Dehalococcoidia bacterium]